MVWGVQRLNVKKSQPNANIVFIKPLAGPDEKIAQDFLERIAAQCLPVMREHHLYVMSLEEFPANREFVGRNFNAGEVIQLVLKSPSSGRWLPFEYVQMVMMHELAHCKQMNHSRAFWAVRNSYAEQMRMLWGKGYTGDGIWGRGATLGTGAFERNTVRAGEVLPEHLCGGTYRSRGRKRKAKPTLSYQERKERRIQKKFGKNGMALGADEETKVKLEKGKRVQAKPRVAGSARGRELRAAAALARFDQAKKEPDIKDDDETESGSESDYDENFPDLDSKDAVDLDGARLVDQKGRGMVRVCEDEALDDPAAKNELEELQNVFRHVKREPQNEEKEVEDATPPAAPVDRVKEEAASASSYLHSIPMAPNPGPEKVTEPVSKPKAKPPPPKNSGTLTSTTNATTRQIRIEPRSNHTQKSDSTSNATTRQIRIEPRSEKGTSQPAATRREEPTTTACGMCSFANPPGAVTCSMCTNVLTPDNHPNCWRCTSDTCRDTAYRNAGDCGICGLCGQPRSDKG